VSAREQLIDLMPDELETTNAERLDALLGDAGRPLLVDLLVEQGEILPIGRPPLPGDTHYEAFVRLPEPGGES